MSKERARRRAEREAEQARQAATRARREERRARWRRLRGRLASVVPKPIRVARQGGLIARRRRAQNSVVAVLFVLVQAASWLLLSGWAARVGVLVLSLLLFPVLVTVIFDRRS
ncbi:hypothetical protein ACGFIV_19485 [Sphaerisporangium sp. NPDC049003]|uniref:hypothetical protein n=1 Tax=Sphaerisporangium sp. NPDC049003 TaxID=3364517 RepID=UPI0037230008